MMNTKFGEKTTQRTQYEVDLNAIKEKSKKSEYTEFVQVRLTEETKEKLVEFCRREKIYVASLVREMVESYLK